MKTILNTFECFVVVFLMLITSKQIISQSYSLEEAVQVPVFVASAPDVDESHYFWDISEINNTNNRLDVAVGVNQILNATTYNFINGNWYKNQYDDNFNGENTSTRFIYQSGYQNDLTYITGLVFSKINSSSSVKDLIVSKGDSLLIFVNSSGSIGTSANQKIFFPSSLQSSGRFTTDNAEDIAVLRNDSIFIFKGDGTLSKLDSIPAFKMGGASGNNVKVLLAQVSSWIEPYATVEGTTSDRDEIIIRQGTTIIIFKNDNNNGISTSTAISNLTSNTEFAVGDVNNDGFNDLLTCSITQGIKIFLNDGTAIDTTADYTKSGESTGSISFADFDKDGWNDLIVNTFDSLKIFLNNHSGSMFSQTRTYSIPVGDGDLLLDLKSPKMSVADLHNEGGLSVLLSGFPAINFEAAPYTAEIMYRYNPVTLDAYPAPAYLFESYVQYHDNIYHPKLLLFDRGDRDFLKYRIYKKIG